LYLFPFEHGKKHLVSQAAFGTRSHNVAGSKQAIDFDMQEGETICAARDGLVVGTKADSTLGGDDRARFFKHSNYVKILHADGSVGLYSHLQFGSLQVKSGDRVAAGDPIARCGNTGFSSDPHLDFKVTLPTAKGVEKTVPLRFRGGDGQPVTVQAAHFYYSHHPGEERIDNTTVFYARNSNAEHTQRVSFWLIEQTNLDVSKKMPLRVSVPPLSERYLCFLRVKDPLQAWRHRYRFTAVPDNPGLRLLEKPAGNIAE